MNPEYVDIHSHLNFNQFDQDRDDIIKELRQQNIWTITVGTNHETSVEAVELANRYSHLFAIIGLHPLDADQGWDRDAFTELEKHSVISGIGECGLDYYRDQDPQMKATQKEVFEKQIEFAISHDLPLMLHCRPSHRTMDAYHEVIDILEQYSSDVGDRLRGNSHFFSGDTEVARRFIDIGFTVSFSGPISFAHEYHEVVKYVPLDSMMADTDAPFAAPRPYRGKRNSPLYIKEIVREIADIKAENLNKVKETLVANALRMFNLKKA